MRILIAYDGSEDADRAAALAAGIDWPAGTKLRVLCVIEPMVLATAMSPYAGIPAYTAELEAQEMAYYRSAVDEVVGRLGAADRDVEGQVVRGRPATLIIDQARAFEADLVIVGSRGHGSIASLLLGSVSGEVVDHAPCPVLVARKTGIERVVFATDASPSAARAERLLASWPIFEGSQIRVVSVAHVDRPLFSGVSPTMYSEVIEAYARDTEEAKAIHGRIAQEAVERLRAAGRSAEPDVRVGDPATEINQVVDAWKADLVVMGSRGQTGLKRLLLGSVARNVVHTGSASVLIVHGPVEGA